MELINQHAELGRIVTDVISQDIAINQTQAKRSADEGEITFRTIFWISLASVAIGVAIAIVASVYLLRAISHPLDRAIGFANDIAQGTLENRIVTDAIGEFGHLLRTLKKNG